MHIHLAPQSIEALAMVISAGGGNDTIPPIGIYRSATKPESFMRGCNVAMSVGSGSRLPALIEALERAIRSGDQTGHDRRERHVRAGWQVRTPARSMASALADEFEALPDRGFHAFEARRR